VPKPLIYLNLSVSLLQLMQLLSKKITGLPQSLHFQISSCFKSQFERPFTFISVKQQAAWPRPHGLTRSAAMYGASRALSCCRAETQHNDPGIGDLSEATIS
jgi:hypothetical protein